MIDPGNVVSFGLFDPDIVNENVLSRMLFSLSVARTVNVDKESVETLIGVPVITPCDVSLNPSGNEPAKTL
jgi:hypothetical protein